MDFAEIEEYQANGEWEKSAEVLSEATAEELKKNDISKVGLLGTKYTMTQEFYKNKLIEAGIDVVIPNQDGVEIVNSIIYNELCLGIISE